MYFYDGQFGRCAPNMVDYMDGIYILGFRNALPPSWTKKKVSSLDILQRRFAAEQIIKENYQEHKSLLEKDLS